MIGANLLAVSLLCCLPLLTLSCYESCSKKFAHEMDQLNSNSTNTTGSQTSNFCKLVANQIECLNHAMNISVCPNEQNARMTRNMLNMYILPDYVRTCGADTNTSRPTSHGTTGLTFSTNTGVVPTSGRLLIVCSQKVQACHLSFNNRLKTNMASTNISGICLTLSQFSHCYEELQSSECGHLVPKNIVSSMQLQHRAMCSEDAQVNAYKMIECTNKTIKCYQHLFHSSVTPQAGAANVKVTCGAFENYTSCMLAVSTEAGCSQFASQYQANVQQLKKQYLYCGKDNGESAMKCVESYRSCSSVFNTSYFPALHSGNLSNVCSALDSYTTCMSRLSPTCSQLLTVELQMVQLLKLQYREKCHPNILRLTSCTQVTFCSNTLLASLSRGPNLAGMCGALRGYFKCMSNSLDTCQLPQSITEVEFGSLDKLMQGYCDKIYNNPKLLRCPAFNKCTTAVTSSFSPNLKNLYEGSTWCTFMQLNIGCAEHALQSVGCYLEDDPHLEPYVKDIDTLRINTCETGQVSARDGVQSEASHAADHGNGSAHLMPVPLLFLVVMVLQYLVLM
ncbi:uncharacterized protein LOC131938657 [Physella acuta]|uniref:uncharacterized protein LOC131938657 n=1 Tax=Physella acuta TaxID=109671 RepID=UPI0027DBCE89|nr:uncharacterized protein LOC131938657 [Physella acuta]